MSVNRKFTRREVLKGLGVATAGTALVACTPQAVREAGSVEGTPQVVEKVVTATPAVKEQKLRIAVFGPSQAEGIAPVKDGFERENPNVTVEVVPIEGVDWEEYFAKILTQIASGNPPDLTIVATEGAHLFAGKKLGAPLDDYVQRDAADLEDYFSDVHPSLIESMMYEGSLYSLPYEFNAANMYYNTSLLAEAGYDHPAPDWTKDDFYEIAKAVTKKDNNETSVFGYGWTNRLWGSWMPWIFVNGSNLLTEEEAPGGEWLWDTFYEGDPAVEGRGGGWRWLEPKANDAANVEALEFMVQLRKEGIAPAVELGKGESLSGFFASKKLGMTPAGGFWVAHLNNSGMAPDAFDVQLWPRWKSQRHQFGAAGLFLMNAAENKDLGWEFLKYSVGREAMESFFTANFSTPTRRSMMTEERYGDTGPEHWEVFYDTLDEHPDTAPIPAPPQANPMTTIFTKYTSLAMSYEMTVQEALDAMQADLEELFAREEGEYYTGA